LVKPFRTSATTSCSRSVKSNGDCVAAVRIPHDGKIVGHRLAIRLRADTREQLMGVTQPRHSIATIPARVQKAAIAVAQQPAVDQWVVGSDRVDREFVQLRRAIGVPSGGRQAGTQPGDLTDDVHPRVVDMPLQPFEFDCAVGEFTAVDEALNKDRPPRHHRHL
jgi:hypothetical protein